MTISPEQEKAWQDLSPHDQFDLATRIAANVGYELTPGHSAGPSDSQRSTTPAAGMREALITIRDWRNVLKQLRDEESLHGYNSALESICDCADRALSAAPDQTAGGDKA